MLLYFAVARETRKKNDTKITGRMRRTFEHPKDEDCTTYHKGANKWDDTEDDYDGNRYDDNCGEADDGTDADQ